MMIWTRRTLMILLGALTTAPVLAAEKAFDQHFDAPPGGHLTLDTDVGSVVIAGRIGRDLSVHVDMSGPNDFLGHLVVTAVQGSEGVTVTGHQAQRSWLDWLFGVGLHHVLYTIEVPADYPVNIRTSGGSLDVRHLSASVQAVTSGGSVNLRDVRGSVYARTSGGGINAAGLNGSTELRTSGGGIAVTDSTGDLNVRTSGGAIHLEHIDGRVQGATSGGSVDAQLTVNDGVSLITSGGSITLRLPANVHGSLDARTSGGRVVSAFSPGSTEIASRNDLRGTVNGGGEPIFLRTSGGSIYVGPLD
jgi:hypothetical protein